MESYQTLDQIASAGVPQPEAADIHTALAAGASPPETWRCLCERVLRPEMPFAVHQMMYYGCYKGFGSDPPAKVVEAHAPKAIVVCGIRSTFIRKMRQADVSFNDFVARVKYSNQNVYAAAHQAVEAYTNILFSSGTTGKPKAIPWTHSSPLKVAADAWCHMDVQKGDVVAWPTNLGWMMGPWLVYASLINGASMALYNGSPLGSNFAKFVQPQSVPGTGELALDPVMFGASTKLLNADHHQVYFQGMPVLNSKVLRRHGDEFERTGGGYYRAHGRADDTMNLGGIKVSSVEIERVCNGVDDAILETAAVGVPPLGGGSEQLVIVVVLNDLGSSEGNLEHLKSKLNSALQKKLNPLFKVAYVVTVPSLPRTTSNKVMRRVLRKQILQLKQVAKL